MKNQKIDKKKKRVNMFKNNLFILIFVLLLPLISMAENEYKIEDTLQKVTDDTLQEIEENIIDKRFIAKVAELIPDYFQTGKLEGWILNNTNRYWSKVHFLISSPETEFYSDFWIYNILPGEVKPICDIRGGSGQGVLKKDIWAAKNLINTDFKFSFIEGKYEVEYVFVMTKPVISKELKFNDQYINISFSISQKQVEFVLFNETTEIIKIDWNQVSYVDVLNEAHKVLPLGVKYIDKEKPKDPTVIPPGAKITNIIYLADYISYSEISHKWIEEPLFPDGPEAKQYKGKSFGIFMALATNRVTKNYFFNFKIKDVL